MSERALILSEVDPKLTALRPATSVRPLCKARGR
jgi:hypothetical protein